MLPRDAPAQPVILHALSSGMPSTPGPTWESSKHCQNHVLGWAAGSQRAYSSCSLSPPVGLGLPSTLFTEAPVAARATQPGRSGCARLALSDSKALLLLKLVGVPVHPPEASQETTLGPTQRRFNIANRLRGAGTSPVSWASGPPVGKTTRRPPGEAAWETQSSDPPAQKHSWMSGWKLRDRAEPSKTSTAPGCFPYLRHGTLPTTCGAGTWSLFQR